MSKLKEIWRIFAICVGLGLASTAIAQLAPARAPTTPPNAAAPADRGGPSGGLGGAPSKVEAPAEEYVLGPEDVVEIEVVGTNDKNRARIYTDGTLQANMIGRLMASGRTPRQLGGDIAAALKSGGYYSDPVVTVEVTSFASRYVTVLGAVGQPGLVPINRRYHLSEILARVGGVREGAADYVVVRPENGTEKRYVVEKLASGAADDDPFVSPGDKIFSPAAEVFYIAGQVKAPGSYPFRADMTIAQAIARAGGLSDSGSEKHVKVKRAGKEMKLESDATILPGDVLTIRERLF